MRYDKYEPLSGGFRALLAADWAAADGVPIGVGLDTSGRVVPGAGNTGILGIVILVKSHKKAGDVVDVMTDGECLEATTAEITGAAAGTLVYAVDATGVLTATATAATPIGFLVEADRLVVRAGT